MEEKVENVEVENNNKNNRGVILAMAFVIVILLVLCVLFATGTISLNKNNTKEENATQENVDKEESKKDENKVEENPRDAAILKLKEALTDNNWVQANLYAKKDAYDEDVTVSQQNLKFMLLEDDNRQPIVIVENSTYDANLTICYKVYLEDGVVKVKSVTSFVGNPEQGIFRVDLDQGLVVYEWLHMGDYKLTAYDVKKADIPIYEEYSCEECDSYGGTKQFNLVGFTNVLTANNINEFLK